MPTSVETESEQRRCLAEGKKHRRHFSKQQEDIIWTRYVSNHMQYLSREMFQAVALELDRSEHSVRYHLRKLIALHRGVPLEFTLDNAFSVQEDARIWDYYTFNVSDSYQSEGAIVTSLAEELQRPRDEVRNRLLWLKGQQNHNPPPGTVATAKPVKKAEEASHRLSHGKSRHNQFYTPEEDALILKSLDEDHLSLKQVAKLIGRTVSGVTDHVKRLKKGHGQKADSVQRSWDCGNDSQEDQEDSDSGESECEVEDEGYFEYEGGGDYEAHHGEDEEESSNGHISVHEEHVDKGDEDNRSIGIDQRGEAYLTRRGASSSTTAVAASADDRYHDRSHKRLIDVEPYIDTSFNKRRKRAADFFADADISDTRGNHDGAESDPQCTDSDIDSFSELENVDDDL